VTPLAVSDTVRMNNYDTITLTGLVATEPHQTGTSGNFPVVSFRLLSFQSHFDRAKSVWVDDDPNWYRVSAFRQLALNVLTSIGKGDRVIVTGRLRIRDWEASGRSGTNIDLNADAIGHDLCWGRTSYSAVPSRAATTTPDAPTGGGTAAYPLGDTGDPAAGGETREVVAAERPVSVGEQFDELVVPFCGPSNCAEG
jgi:single-strand DNA-binding protein